MFGVSTLAAAGLSAQDLRQRTYANPIDIDYKYNFEQHNQGISYRSGADPVIVVHRGEYYLFETIGDGYWRSKDLANWEHVTPTRWPLTDIVAPAALSVRDTIYLLPSTTSPLPIMMLTEPATGRVDFYNRLLPWLPMARQYEPGVFARPIRCSRVHGIRRSSTTRRAIDGSSTGTRRMCIRSTSSSSTRRNSLPTRARRTGCSVSIPTSTAGRDSVRITATRR